MWIACLPHQADSTEPCLADKKERAEFCNSALTGPGINT